MKIKPRYHERADELGNIDIAPFARINWKTAESRDGWAQILDEAAHAKGDAEWRSVMDGQTERKAAIIHVSDQTREEWIRRVGDYGLIYRDIRYSKPYDGFAHKFYPTNKNDPNRLTYSVLAQDKDVADKMVEAELELEGDERHRTVGKLLGFPDCCLDFFADEWNPNEGQTDPMYEASCNSDNAEMIDGDPENIRIVNPNPGANIMWKYFGWSFVTHIPCSWDCERSIEIARDRYRIMSENGYRSAADALAQWLEMPMVWDGYHALAKVRNQHVVGTSQTCNYWSKKRIEWGEKHAPKSG